MGSVHFSHDTLILDACCAINLYASGKISEILESIPCNCMIADYVINKEVQDFITILHHNGAGEIDTDLQFILGKELLNIVTTDNEIEMNDYIDFAYESLENGESITGAIAKNRDWGIATDDGKSIEVFKRMIPAIQIVTTPELIKHWYEIRKPDTEELHRVLARIRSKGRYSPGKKHALYNWWQHNS